LSNDGPGQEEALLVERSGGFAGLTRRATLPTTELSPEAREALEECLDKPPAEPSGPDRFVYHLRLGSREAHVQEDRVPPQLAPTLTKLFQAPT
jgi:hypothetical protein